MMEAPPDRGPGGGMAAAGPEEGGERSAGDSGNVSQSHSNASGLGGQEDDEGDALDASLSATAAAYSTYLLVERSAYSEQVESLEKSLEELLTRVDEFVGMLDMIRSDSSQVINESIPEIYTKATEMRQVYRRIDKLEAFVKMVANHVAGMEERVVKAETDLGAFPSTFKKILHTISIPSFRNKSSSSRQQTAYEPPVLFKTEDYFPCPNEAPY
ncbi:biogenesis of lysosome-related organelles complex 1 subunit 4 [Coturnix japonica]|uniref:Biosis of lysosomal organelles complex 1 subunit 4 n=1 Tax=Coturnix japonica TaxID=93934 RepID=A0A8C2T6P5_COTJA|nr:biogenesis of lysosome-related organelles complex 1 subunit 4 [Coturnix japonica]